jgi:hypothetical protein
MIIATVETRNFTFQTLAASKSDATHQLLAAWRDHADQYGADRRMMLEMLRDGEVNYVEIEVGQTLRDGEVLR